MGRFQVFQSNRSFIAPLDLINDPRNTIVTKIITYSSILIAFYFGFITSIILIYERITEMQFVLEAALAIGIPQFMGVYFSVRLRKDKVNSLHTKLQEIVDKGGDGEIPLIHWNNELKCRKFTKSMSNFIIANEAVLTLSVIYSTVCVLFGKYDTSNWVLQFPMETPFDEETVIGWYCIWCIQFIQSLIYSVCMVTVTTYFVCCCYYIGALCDHLGNDAERIKTEIITTKSGNLYRKLNKRLCEAVDMHVTIFDVFNLVTSMNKLSIFALLPVGGIFLALTILKLEYSTINASSIAYAIVCIGCSLVWPYLFCHHATIATQRILHIGSVAYNLNWIDFPIKMKKDIILIIRCAQDQVQFTGLDLIICTLTVFGNVVRSSISYYLIFRSVSTH